MFIVFRALTKLKCFPNKKQPHLSPSTCNVQHLSSLDSLAFMDYVYGMVLTAVFPSSFDHRHHFVMEKSN